MKSWEFYLNFADISRRFKCFSDVIPNISDLLTFIFDLLTFHFLQMYIPIINYKVSNTDYNVNFAF